MPKRSARNSAFATCSKARSSATEPGAGQRATRRRQSGADLWADRFEEDVADLFKLQDEMVARLANTLGIELVKAEAEKGGRSKNPDAVDLTMRGWALVGRRSRRRKKTKRRAPCLNRRSRSSPTMPMRWRGAPTLTK